MTCASSSVSHDSMDEHGEDARLTHIKRLLEKRKFEDLNRAIMDAQNSEVLQTQGWDLVPLVCSLTTADRGFAEACANALKNLAKVGNPKELLVGLLEQMDFLEPDVRFQLLLGAIQTVLLRLRNAGGARWLQSLSWVLGALDSHAKKLPIPMSRGLEGKAKLLQDSDPDVMRIEDAVGDLIQFCQQFIQELVSSRDISSSSTTKQRNLWSGFLVQILHPLAHVDIASSEGTPKGTSRVHAEKIVSDLSLLETNVYKFCDRKSRIQRSEGDPKSDTFTGEVSLQALGTLLYIVLVEGHRKECLPCVYSHRHTLEASLPATLNLLRGSPNEYKTIKGLLLFEHLLKYIRNKEFGPELLDLPSITDSALVFERIAVFDKCTESRRLAIRLLPVLIDRFDDEGRYKFVYSLLNAVGHSGVKGIVIGTFKQHVHEALSEVTPCPPQLRGSSMLKMVMAITALQQGVETDLMDDSERILSALNFLRFVLLRDDADRNVTGIWDTRDAIRRDFLDVLMKALDISRAHYQLEMKLQSEKGAAAAAGLDLPPMPPEQTIHCLKSALTRLDMIHGVVVRVLEIMDGKK